MVDDLSQDIFVIRSMTSCWIAFLVYLLLPALLCETVLSKNNSHSGISGGDNLRNRSFSEANFFGNIGRNGSKSIKNGNNQATVINLKTMAQMFRTPESKSLMDFIRRQKYSNKSRDIMKLKSRVQSVCVFHHNWRTASLFELNALSIRGNGSLKYIVNDNTQFKKSCKSGLVSTPYNVELVSAQGNIVNYNYQYAGEIKGALSSKPAKRIVTGDELCDCKFPDCGIFPNMKGVVARQYFSEKLLPQWEFGGSFNARPNSIAFIPLGPRSDFGLIHWTQQATESYSTNRTWLFNLIISPTSESRKQLVKVINSTNFTKNFKSPVNYFMNVANHWHGKFGAAAPDTINSTKYKQILLSSVFTLCPNGA